MMCDNCFHFPICCFDDAPDECPYFLSNDLVEVVRCKDCKHSIKRSEDVYECGCFCAMTTPEFYCADGERKDNGTD